MILMSLCNSCLQPFELLVQPSDAHLVKQIADKDGLTAPCPRLCGGRINLVGNPVIKEMASKLKEPMRVTGQELYKAVNGMGLPDEIPTTMEVVEALLLANSVVAAAVEETDGKIYLHELSLSNGLTLHLAGGPRGSRVIKITKENQHGSQPAS
jgi:hypothetical protein